MPESQMNLGTYARRLFLAAVALIVVVIILFLLRSLAQTLLVIVAGVLLAIFLNGLTRFVMNHFTWPHGVSLTVVVFLLLFLLAGMFYFAGPRITEQVDRLAQRIPQAVEQIKDSIAQTALGKRAIERMPDFSEILPFGRQQVVSAPAAFSTFIGAVVNVAIILFIAIYLAATPRVYIDAVLHLLPQRRRGRIREVIVTINEVLQRWFVGRFASMFVVGVLTALGLWIAGIPLAFVLGLIAALLSFVPFIGPILSAIPALLIALAESPVKVLYALIVYVAVQTLESYVITPLIEKKAVSLPPALLITAQIIMGAVFGIIGIFLATPFAVVVVVAIQMLYIQDILEDDVAILGHD